jgi:hypothetical protein
MLVLFFCIFAFIFILTENIKNNFEKTLQDQTISNLKSLSSDNTKIIDFYFNKTTSAVLLPYIHYTQIAHETSFNLNDVPGYFDDGSNDFLATPLEFDSRYNQQVSFKHSSYMLAYLYRSNMTNISSSMLYNINRTMHSDEILVHSYKNYKSDFVAVYTGFNDGLFLSYPGVGTQNTDPSRKYNPRVRGWYTSAMSNNDLIYTNPYKDFNGKGWMITMAKKVQINGIVKAVAAADILISKINDIISKININESGKATLIDNDGVIIADKEWAASPSSNSISYNNLLTPKITSSMWAQLSSIEKDTLIDNNNHLIYATKIKMANNWFILLLSVLKNVVFNELNNVIEATNKWRGETIGIVVGVVVLVVIIVISITIYFGFTLSQIIEEICNNTDEIMKQLGKKNMYENIQPVTESDITEMNRISNGFNNMINKMKNEEVKNNPFFGRSDIFQLGTPQEATRNPLLYPH